MEKTPYLRMIFVGIGFGLITVFVTWSAIYWQDATTLTKAEQSNYSEGKGRKPNEIYYCSFKHIYPCDFAKANNIFISYTFAGIALLPAILTHLNMYSYSFYGTSLAAFLLQLLFYKSTIKWKKHLEKSPTGLRRDF